MDDNELLELKKYLSDRTLIGEYVGGDFNQHITYEAEEELIFFAASKKNLEENDICPIEET